MNPKLAAKLLTRPPRVAAIFAKAVTFRVAVLVGAQSVAGAGRPAQCLPARRARTYASALAALTEEQEAGRLRLSPLVITSGGELLTPATQHRAEKAFRCLVTQAYAASEAMPLELPCRQGWLHLNSDWFLTEPVDAAGKPVPRGENRYALHPG